MQGGRCYPWELSHHERLGPRPSYSSLPVTQFGGGIATCECYIECGLEISAFRLQERSNLLGSETSPLGSVRTRLRVES